MVPIALFFALLLLPVGTRANPSPPSPPRWSTRSYLETAWTLSTPAGPTAREIRTPSPMGAQLGYRIRMTPKRSIGIRAGWQLLEDPPSLPTETHLRLFQAVGTIHRYFPKREILMPWFGAGAGLTRVTTITRHPHTRLHRQSWQPATLLESGLIVMAGRIPLLLSAGFQFVVPTPQEPTRTLILLSLGVVLPN